MRWIFSIVLAASTAIAAPAMAQTRSDCPVAADVQKGIQLTRQKPLLDMVLRRDGALVIMNRTTQRPGGKRRKTETTYLDGLVPLIRREGREVIQQKLTNNTKIVRNGRVRNWNSQTEVLFNNRRRSEETVKVRRAGKATWTGNGCTYDVTRVIVTNTIKGRPDSHFEYFYAPELGVSLGGYKLRSDGRTRQYGFLPERISRR